MAGVANALLNDLEPAAEAVTPALAEFRLALHGAAGREPFLAGSGSAYCVWLDDPETARATAERVGRELGVATFAGMAGLGERSGRSGLSDEVLSDPADDAANGSS